MYKKIIRFIKEETGAVAIVFALALPMVMGAAGVAVDIAQAYNVRSRLADALDKAALAGGSTLGTPSEVEQRVEDFFNANYKTEKLGTTHSLNVDVGSDYTITVSAYAQVPTTFMSVFGDAYDYMDIFVETKVKRELAGVEAVLVLDVTGSMSGSKLSGLKTASTNFLDIMFTNITDAEFLKIGIVPFSGTVNVGPYGSGLDLLGDAYGNPFVDNPATDDYVDPASDIAYGTGTNDWHGCITERASPDDTNDNASPNWGMYRFPKMCTYWWYGNCYNWTEPNRYCPEAPIVPLTNNQTALQNSINGLTASGPTYSNVGMAWGWHVITPTEPFIEGVPLDDSEWTRTIVLMTDGDNSVYNTYSAYGESPGLSNNDLDNKLLTVCNNIKADNITVYTITFGSGVGSGTQTLFENCASDPAKYFHSSTGSDLDETFQLIASQLSQLHIVK